MGEFPLNHPTNPLEVEINNYFWVLYNDITDNWVEVFKNDLPNQMSNNFRGYGRINQFNDNYHYFKVRKGTPEHPGEETHRYRSQIIAAYLERRFDKDFEVHHILNAPRDKYGKYDDTAVIIIYGDSKEEVKRIHQRYHNLPINMSRRQRGEIK